jgi:hypothetical protein
MLTTQLIAKNNLQAIDNFSKKLQVVILLYQKILTLQK